MDLSLSMVCRKGRKEHPFCHRTLVYWARHWVIFVATRNVGSYGERKGAKARNNEHDQHRCCNDSAPFFETRPDQLPLELQNMLLWLLVLRGCGCGYGGEIVCHG